MSVRMARRCCSLLAIRYSLLFPSALLATVPLRWYCPDCAPTLGAPPLDEAAASSDDAAAASEDGRYSRGSFDDEPAEDMLDDAASDVPPAARSDDAMSLVGSDAAAPHDEVASTRSGGTGLVTSLGTQLLSSDDDDDVPLGPRQRNRARRRRAGADAPPRARLEVRYEADGRPILQGRRDLDVATRRQLMVAWVERQTGQPWLGTEAQLRAAWRRRPDNDNERRVRQRRANPEPRREQQRNARQRVLPPAYRKARNASRMLAFDASTYDAVGHSDVGHLGDRECCYCAAQLWPGEAKRVPRRGYCGGSLCCSRGAVQLEPVGRVQAIDDLFEDRRSATDLAKHARRQS